MEIKEAILNSSLPNKDELCKLVRQSYLLRRNPKDRTSEDPLVSRMGGLPDLPRELTWPRWKTKPLSFVAQINLAELPIIPDRDLLPGKGMLYYFYDAARESIGNRQDEKESFAVLYANPDTSHEFMRTTQNQRSADERGVPARIEFDVIESEPGWEHPYVMEILGSWEKTLEYGRIVGVGSNLHEGHRILGYPKPVQTPVAMDCEAVRLGYWDENLIPKGTFREITRQGVGDWELLLQVESDEELNMYWPPDSGILYYMIRHNDLVAGRFDRSWMVKQFS
jgi:uncharacterized protein YwqG